MVMARMTLAVGVDHFKKANHELLGGGDQGRSESSPARTRLHLRVPAVELRGELRGDLRVISVHLRGLSVAEAGRGWRPSRATSGGRRLVGGVWREASGGRRLAGGVWWEASGGRRLVGGVWWEGRPRRRASRRWTRRGAGIHAGREARRGRGLSGAVLCYYSPWASILLVVLF